MTAAADVIDFSGTRRANEFRKCFDQIETVDVVAHLFAFVTKNTVRPAAHGADHKIGKKTVQFRPGVRGSGETTATERYRGHSEITSVFLNENVTSNLGRAKKRMLRVIYAHRFSDARLDFVDWFCFSASGQVRPPHTA